MARGTRRNPATAERQVGRLSWRPLSFVFDVFQAQHHLQRDRDLRRVAAGREPERPRNVIHNSGFLR
jgi:hypothetical protein